MRRKLTCHSYLLAIMRRFTHSQRNYASSNLLKTAISLLIMELFQSPIFWICLVISGLFLLGVGRWVGIESHKKNAPPPTELLVTLFNFLKNAPSLSPSVEEKKLRAKVDTSRASPPLCDLHILIDCLDPQALHSGDFSVTFQGIPLDTRFWCLDNATDSLPVIIVQKKAFKPKATGQLILTYKRQEVLSTPVPRA